MTQLSPVNHEQGTSFRINESLRKSRILLESESSGPAVNVRNRTGAILAKLDLLGVLKYRR